MVFPRIMIKHQKPIKKRSDLEKALDLFIYVKIYDLAANPGSIGYFKSAALNLVKVYFEEGLFSPTDFYLDSLEHVIDEYIQDRYFLPQSMVEKVEYPFYLSPETWIKRVGSA